MGRKTTRGQQPPQRRRRQALVVLPAALLALSATGCAESVNAGGADGTGLNAAGELKVCTFLPFKPFEFSQGNKTVGFDFDLVDLVAKDLKAKVTVNDTPFEGIQSGEALNAAQCDLAAAGMTITDVRRKVMDFSTPYFDSTQALLVKDKKYTSLESLRGKTIAVQQATTGEKYTARFTEQYGFKVRQFEDTGLQLNAVKSGQADAAINDNGVVLDFAKDNPDTTVTKEFVTGEKYGFGVRKGNTTLLQKVNAVLAKARQDGSYDRIYKKWFGKEPSTS